MTRLTLHIDAARMCPYDSVAYHQSQTQPSALLGGKKWLENSTQVFMVDSETIVGHPDRQCFGCIELGRYRKFSPARHCIEGIGAEIYQLLLQLLGIAIDIR